LLEGERNEQSEEKGIHLEKPQESLLGAGMGKRELRGIASEILSLPEENKKGRKALLGGGGGSKRPPTLSIKGKGIMHSFWNRVGNERSGGEEWEESPHFIPCS